MDKGKNLIQQATHEIILKTHATCISVYIHVSCSCKGKKFGVSDSRICVMFLQHYGFSNKPALAVLVAKCEKICAICSETHAMTAYKHTQNIPYRVSQSQTPHREYLKKKIQSLFWVYLIPFGWYRVFFVFCLYGRPPKT